MSKIAKPNKSFQRTSKTPPFFGHAFGMIAQKPAPFPLPLN